jgi:glycerophosphoryl diester phosphodiesterase
MATPQRIGHRGAPRAFLENTLSSFAEAFSQGADAIELDVHVTRDGVAVVHHDPAFGRLTGGLHDGVPLPSLTLSEVLAVPLVGRKAGETARVPTLLAVLESLPPHGFAYVEIKGGSEEAVAAALQGFADRTAVHSFDHDAIARMRDVAPSIPRGLLFDRPIPATEVVRKMGAAAARDAWPALRVTDHHLIDAVHEAGGRVIVWTVNTRSDAEELARMGVDGICTDVLASLKSG